MVFTPKHASWLNQVEIFFSILTRRLLKHGQFKDTDDLVSRVKESARVGALALWR